MVQFTVVILEGLIMLLQEEFFMGSEGGSQSPKDTHVPQATTFQSQNIPWVSLPTPASRMTKLPNSQKEKETLNTRLA